VEGEKRAITNFWTGELNWKEDKKEKGTFSLTKTGLKGALLLLKQPLRF